MLPTGRAFKALPGFRRALVPDTLQAGGKKETAAGNRQIQEKKERLDSCLLCFISRLWCRQPFQCRSAPILSKMHVFVEEGTTDAEMPILGLTDNILSSSATSFY